MFLFASLAKYGVRQDLYRFLQVGTFAKKVIVAGVVVLCGPSALELVLYKLATVNARIDQRLSGFILMSAVFTTFWRKRL